MRAENYKIFNDETLLNCKRYHLDKLDNLFADPWNQEPFYVNSECIYHSRPSYAYNEPERWVHDALDELAPRADVIKDIYTFRPLSVEFGPYLVRFVDSIFGATPFFSDITNSWDSHPVYERPGELPIPDIGKLHIVDISLRAAKEFASLKLRLPTFSLPTLSSPLNTGFNLYGSRFFEFLITHPKEMKRDLELITEIIVELHHLYRDILSSENIQMVVSPERFQPYGYSQLCGCSTQLISAEMYAEMFMELDERILTAHGKAGMIHLCGRSTQHIGNFFEMPSLKSVQINDAAAVDIEKYHMGLRTDQVIYFIPCKKIGIEEAVKITDGRRLVIHGNNIGQEEQHDIQRTHKKVL